MAKVYVASSWRNPHYPETVETLRRAGHRVWDWRNPPTGGGGFGWQQAGLKTYQHGDKVDVKTWRKLLGHPVALTGYASDHAGMEWCDVGVILYPCGNSAHLEAGWLAGRGKKVHLLVQGQVEPDLMVLALNGYICSNFNELLMAIVGRWQTDNEDWR